MINHELIEIFWLISQTQARSKTPFTIGQKWFRLTKK